MGIISTGTRPFFALLPLDDRPPNLQFPRRLAAIGGLNLRLPPRRLLGRFLRPGEAESLWQWLAQAARGADAVIVSCDMLAYGGLVASRTTRVPLKTAIRHIHRLRDLKRRFPHLRIYAFAVIPRLGLTVSSARLARLGPALARHDELRYTSALDQPQADELSRLTASLPRDLVAGHHAMRRRNLAVNQRLVALVGQGAVDFLVLAQEDAPIAGPHILEQAALAAEAAEQGAGRGVRIFPGADEQCMALLARAAGTMIGADLRVYPVYSTPGGAESVALFEDRPLCMTAAGQIDAAGLRIASAEKDADIVLALHSPPTPAQADIGHTSPESAPRARFLRHIAALARGGRPVALADVAYCNGADPALVRALAERKAMPHLAAFAGWNTAGNSIGCALAQAVLRLLGERQRSHGCARAQIEFLFERLADDFGYQTVVRRDAYEFARKELGAWPLNLRRGRRRAAAYVHKRLTELAGSLFAEHFAGEEVNRYHITELRELRVRLPWPRLFEVEVEATIGLK